MPTEMPTDDFLRAIVRAEARSPDRIQGFLYGERRVIRDVWKPHGQQVLWESTVSQCSDDEFQEQCRVERLRVVFAEVISAAGS